MKANDDLNAGTVVDSQDDKVKKTAYAMKKTVVPGVKDVGGVERESAPTLSFDEWVKANAGRRSGLTADEDKRRKREMLISSIGDAISALSGMYAASKGAPAVYDGTHGMGAVTKRRYDDLIQQRKESYSEYLNAKRMADQNAYKSLSLALRRDEEARRRDQSDLAWRKQDWLEKYQQGILDVKEEQLKIDADYKAGRISIDERNAASRELQAQAAWLRAQNSGGSSGGGRGHGMQDYNEETSVTYDGMGRVVGRTKTRTVGQGGGQGGGKGTGYGNKNKGKGY